MKAAIIVLVNYIVALISALVLFTTFVWYARAGEMYLPPAIMGHWCFTNNSPLNLNIGGITAEVEHAALKGCTVCAKLLRPRRAFA